MICPPKKGALELYFARNGLLRKTSTLFKQLLIANIEESWNWWICVLWETLWVPRSCVIMESFWENWFSNSIRTGTARWIPYVAAWFLRVDGLVWQTFRKILSLMNSVQSYSTVDDFISHVNYSNLTLRFSTLLRSLNKNESQTNGLTLAQPESLKCTEDCFRVVVVSYLCFIDLLHSYALLSKVLRRKSRNLAFGRISPKVHKSVVVKRL